MRRERDEPLPIQVVVREECEEHLRVRPPPDRTPNENSLILVETLHLTDVRRQLAFLLLLLRHLNQCAVVHRIALLRDDLELRCARLLRDDVSHLLCVADGDVADGIVVARMREEDHQSLPFCRSLLTLLCRLPRRSVGATTHCHAHQCAQHKIKPAFHISDY